MKNSTFIVIVAWSVIWTLITLNYFSSIKFGYVFSLLSQHGFEVLIVLYGITGTFVNYVIINEEFKLEHLRNKYKQNNNLK